MSSTVLILLILTGSADVEEMSCESEPLVSLITIPINNQSYSCGKKGDVRWTMAL